MSEREIQVFDKVKFNEKVQMIEAQAALLRNKDPKQEFPLFEALRQKAQEAINEILDFHDFLEKEYIQGNLLKLLRAFFAPEVLTDDELIERFQTTATEDKTGNEN